MFGEAVTLRPGNFRFVYFSSGGRDIYAYSDVVTIRSGILMWLIKGHNNLCLGLEPCLRDPYQMHLKPQKMLPSRVLSRCDQGCEEIFSCDSLKH